MKEHNQIYYLCALIKYVKNWPMYFLHRFGIIKNKNIHYSLRNGMKITTRSFAIDRCGINEIWLDHIYEPKNFDWKKCSTIIDIGANIGAFTLRAASLAPSAKIYAFEAEPETAKVLQNNINQNNLNSRVYCYDMGVGKSAGKQIFYFTPGGSWFGSLHKPPKIESYPINIQTTTLQNIFDENKLITCDVLKLDCEGAEYDILYNLPTEYLKKIQNIVMEYHNINEQTNENHNALRKFLTDNGFTVTERINSVFYATRKK